MDFLKDYQSNQSYSSGDDVVQLVLITYTVVWIYFSLCSVPRYYFTGSKNEFMELSGHILEPVLFLLPWKLDWNNQQGYQTSNVSSFIND